MGLLANSAPLNDSSGEATLQGHITVTQKELLDYLLHQAPEGPVFIWGPPGIGKTAIVEQFASEVGMECVSMVGTTMLPEDIVGTPNQDHAKRVTRFYPPEELVREKPFCLFLDELNSSNQDVQKSFYSLIQSQRVGSYRMPQGSVVIGAGNRAQDAALARQMPSALVNRITHLFLTVSAPDWLEWAGENNVHPWVIEFIQLRHDYLSVAPPKIEAPFSTPRSWTRLSNCLKAYKDEVDDRRLAVLAFGNVSAEHAVQFRAFVKTVRNKFAVAAILKGSLSWPAKPDERDVLVFLAQSFRNHLLKFLPKEQPKSGDAKDLAHVAKGKLKELCLINEEIAQMVVAKDPTAGSDGTLPAWFMADVVQVLPMLVARDNGQK